MKLNAKERAVESALYGVLSVGGILTTGVMYGMAQEHQGEMRHTITHADHEAAAHEMNQDRAIMWGAVALALPGIVRLWRCQGVWSQPELSSSSDHN